MLFEHWVRRAASRADCTAGSSSEIRMPMIVITTSSSTRVKPQRRLVAGETRRYVHMLSSPCLETVSCAKRAVTAGCDFRTDDDPAGSLVTEESKRASVDRVAVVG